MFTFQKKDKNMFLNQGQIKQELLNFMHKFQLKS